MRPQQRKTNPRVIDGRVQKKNHWGTTGDIWSAPQPLLRFERRKPGPGFKHVLGKQHLYEFIELIPDWTELSKGLDAVILAPGRWAYYGRYHCGYSENGFIYLRAWPEELVEDWSDDFLKENQHVLDLLGVPYSHDGVWWRVQWTEKQARGFMLFDVFLHELGHHIDRMTTKSKRECSNGEPFANKFALELGTRIWPAYSRIYDRY